VELFPDYVPRLLITEFPSANLTANPTANQTTAKSEHGEGDLKSSSSLNEIMKELSLYEKKQTIGDGGDNILGCFELVNKTSKDSMDSEEDGDIMKYFQVCAKQEQIEKQQEVGEMSTKSSRRSTNKQEENQEGSEEKSEVSQSLVTSYLCTTASGTTTKTNSACLKLYKNGNIGESSETARYTSLTVSNESSPPASPQNQLSSTAQRVKFTSSFADFLSTPAQTEPISTFEASPTSSDDSFTENTAKYLSKLPVHCPITNCSNFNVPSNFCNHMTIDHPHVGNQKVLPGQLINMNLNHKGRKDLIVCQRLFLLGGKIR
jgi:hypothetical protein